MFLSAAGVEASIVTFAVAVGEAAIKLGLGSERPARSAHVVAGGAVSVTIPVALTIAYSEAIRIGVYLSSIGECAGTHI
jgi:hypothetical protein